MLVWCEPPLSICRIQWLDMRDCVPLQERLERYQTRFERLADVIEQDRINTEGAHARLLRLLDPLPFDAELAFHLLHFQGRQWLFDRIGAWMAGPGDQRFFWVVGDPGVGKTAIAARLCETRGDVAAFHLCRYGHRQKADPRTCVLSLAYQLASQLPDYQQRLDALPLEELVLGSDARTLFDRLFVEPLWANFPRPSKPVAMVIDALDEATVRGRNELAAFLAADFERTPDWLRLILTSSPDPVLDHLLQGLTPFRLDARSPDNLDDIRSYLRRQIPPTIPEPMIEQIVIRSEGLFLYVVQLLRELGQGLRTPEQLPGVPSGLGGLFAQFFGRRFENISDYRAQILPALETLAAAPDDLPVDDLAEARGWNDYARRDVLNALVPLFSAVGGLLRPFHRAAIVWLTDERRAGPYYVSSAEGHRRLADDGWDRYARGVTGMSEYTCRHLPDHLRQAGQWGRLSRLLQDDTFLSRFLGLEVRDALRSELLAAWERASAEGGADTIRAEGPAVAALAQGLAFRARGEHTGAIPHLEAATAGPSAILSAYAWIELAWVYKDHDPSPDHAASLTRAQTALHHAQGVPLSPGTDLIVAEATASMGWLLKDLGHANVAEQSFRDALAIYRRRRIKRRVAWTRRDLGCLFRDTGRLDKAEARLTRALRWFRASKDSWNQAVTLKDLGVLLLLRFLEAPPPAGQPFLSRARHAFIQARRLARGDTGDDLQAWALRYQGLALAYGGDLPGGVARIRRAAGRFRRFTAANRALCDYCAEHAAEVRRPHLLERFGHLPQAVPDEYGRLLEGRG
jgi:tetratricopeptide (TPR) repeat protein